jgi:AcrR family transcriptional regulator
MTSRKVNAHPRKRPHQSRAAATVEAMLTAAGEAFAREGFARANVNHIAARAGVSVGSLYQYYPSKEALLVALIERHTEARLTALEAALDAVRSAPLAAAVRHTVGVMVDAHRAPLHQTLARELDEIGRLDGVQRAIDARAGCAVATFIAARRDEIRVPDVEFAAFLLVRAVDLLTHAALADRRAALVGDALVDELTALVLGYLSAERPSHREEEQRASNVSARRRQGDVQRRRGVAS